MEIVQLICHFGYTVTVFLSCMFSGFYGIQNAIKSTKHARKKYDIARMAYDVDYFHYKKKNSVK